MDEIVREDNFSPEEREKIKELSKAVKITETTAGILYARGQNTAEKMLRFLDPSKENFLSPFLLSGMREAVELLKIAKAEDWQIAIFGDYDADGIGALAILSRALKRYGLRAKAYLPEREDGYGLSVEAVDMMFEDCLPDLVITVDCGISCAKEITYIKESGAYAIVTDHHELPETLPDCICIDPKIKGEYPYDNLCGAGVAFKLACALIGERAYDLLDFCALSTIADSVPLLGENRDIVSEGLKLIAERPRPAFSKLLGDKGESPNSQTLAFTLVPRINAAGRMGDAHAALALFLSEDETEISELSEKLIAYNEQRQKLCDELYLRAKQELLQEGAFDRSIVLCGEDWRAGLIGIVAARLSEEYHRPALLFVKKNGVLRGSARSVERVNIFEAIKACAKWTEGYGGHAQAAGVTLKEENFLPFKRALNEYLDQNYDLTAFEPTISVCGVLNELSEQLARELMRLEPFGVGNKRPCFLFGSGRLNAQLIKPLSPHVTFSDGGTDFVYFNGARDLTLLESDVEKQLIFECNLSKYRGRESLKGVVRGVVYSGDGAAKDPDLFSFEHILRALKGKMLEVDALPAPRLDQKMGEALRACAYGVCIVAEHGAALRDFPALCELPKDLFHLRYASVRNAVLLSPEEDCDLSAYREIFFLETPVMACLETGAAHLYANADNSLFSPISRLDLSREHMIKLYTFLRGLENRSVFHSLARTARSLEGEFTAEEILFSMAVFEELGLLDLSEDRIRLMRGKKTELTSSQIYSAAIGLREG